MHKRDEWKIDLISGIDEKLVDRVSEERFQLLSRLRARIKKRNRRILGVSITAGALAACILILALLLPALLLPAGSGGGGEGSGTPILPAGKQIPIYQGMSVSDTAPVVSESAALDSVLLLSAKGDIHGHRPEIDKDKPFGEGHREVGDVIGDSLDVDSSKDERYYAKKNSDIYITVHLSNPDEFEILSFTLNGVKYSNYMFEAGSDLENLVLKVNTGDSDGIVEYTIDAIKYVDGTEIKDVRMEGERTVSVVITPEDQPTAALTLTPDFHSLAVSVEVTDREELIGASEKNGVFAYLYDGETLVGEKALKIGENAVVFEKLTSNTLYEVAIVAVYDALDGEGRSMHLLSKKAMYTKAYVLFDAVKLSGDTLSFSLLWDASLTDRTLASLTLYSENEKIKEIPIDATLIEGLDAEKSYELRATYQSEDYTETIVLTFSTGKLYPISFVTNGGDEIGVMYLAANDVLPTPVRTGYTFGGWYTDAKLNLSNQTDKPPTEAATLYARWNEETKPEQLTYTVTGDGVTVTGLSDETLRVLHLPAYIGGIPVVAVGDGAFDAVPLTNAVLGEHVTSIGDNAFKDCSALTEVTLPDGLTELASCLFEGCTSLEKITLSERVTTIGYGTFKDCTSLESFDLPETVVRIAADAFSGCDFVTVENGIHYLENWVVGSDADITAANVKAGTLYIVDRAFASRNQLRSVTLPEGLLFIGHMAFAGSALETIELPEGVTGLGYDMFVGCTSLEGCLTVPASVTDMGRSQEFYDTRLTEIKILSDSEVNISLPETIEKVTIGKKTSCGSSWGDFSALREIHVPSMEAWLDFVIFNYDPGVQATPYENDAVLDNATLYIDGEPLGWELVIPEGVTEIPAGAFAFCALIERVVLPSTLEEIGDWAFYGCSNIREVYNCSSLTLDPFAFGADEDLDGNPINSPNMYTPTEGESIYFAENEFLFRKENGTFVLMSCESTDTELILPASVGGKAYRISDSAFAGWSHLTRVTIPANAVSVLGGFQNCTALERIDILEGVTVISPNTFNGCTALKTVTLPQSLTSINTSFQGCSSLEQISIPDSVDWLGGGAFDGCTSLLEKENGVTYVDKWALFFDDRNVTNVMLRDDTFGIAMNFYQGGWAQSIEIPDSVKVICVNAFGGSGLTETENGIWYVDKWAVGHDYYMDSSVTLRTDTVGIASSAFARCTFSTIELPATLKSINESAFKNCMSLTAVTVPEGVDYLGYGAFSGCTALETVRLPKSLTFIGGMVFQNCTALESITVTEGGTVYKGSGNCVIEVESGRVIAVCKNSELPTDGSVTVIGRFAYRTGLTSVIIPKTVTSIESYAFAGDTTLISVSFAGTCAEWAEIEIGYHAFYNVGTTVVHCSDGDVLLQ